MKWSADRKEARFFPFLFYFLDRPFDRFRMTSDNDLTWTVKVGRRQNFSKRNLLTYLFNLLLFHAEDGGHCSFSYGNSLLHKFSTKTNDLHCFGKGERPGSH